MIPNYWPWDLVYPPFLRVGVTCALYLTSRIWQRCWDVCDYMYVIMHTGCSNHLAGDFPDLWVLEKQAAVLGLKVCLRASKKLKPWTEFCQHSLWAWKQTLPQSSLRWGCSPGWQPGWALWAPKQENQRSCALIYWPTETMRSWTVLFSSCEICNSIVTQQ